MTNQVANSTTPPVYVDRFSLPTLLTASSSIRKQAVSPRRFWATPSRPMSDSTRDIVEIRFPGPRIINYMTLQTAKYPHLLVPQWKTEDDDSEWQPFFSTNGINPISTPTTSSTPAVITGRGDLETGNPQHSVSLTHWTQVSWEVKPVEATRIRLVLVRIPGTAPTNLNGQPIPYSLAVKNWQVGYRVDSASDIPMSGIVQTQEDTFGSSIDLLGSRVVFSVKRDSAINAIEPASGKFWRSEPQPVSYAVVNYFADVRDGSGDAQLIDRFFLDPLTVGPNVNVYYSNDDPSPGFEPDEEYIPFGALTVTGTVAGSASILGITSNDQYLIFSDPETQVQVDAAALAFDSSNPWWIGMAINLQYDNTDTNTRDICQVGAGRLFWDSGSIVYATDDGINSYSMLMPSNLPINADLNIILAYMPEGAQPVNTDVSTSDDPTQGYHVYVQMGTATPLHLIGAIINPAVKATTLGFGGTLPAFHLRSMVVKSVALTAADVVAFNTDSEDYPLGAPDRSSWPGTAVNSVLRFHPSGISPDAPTGFVGGPGNFFSDLIWTPIMRDFSMKQGFMYLPPTLAKFFKFEMTNLVPEHYEVFVPIQRSVQLFSTDTYDKWVALTGSTGVDYPPGMATSMSQTSGARYSDAVGLLSQLGSTSDAEDGYSPTEALYIQNPDQAQKVSALGWIWNFQPWHVGSSAPQFMATQKHYYETVQVSQVTKVGFFAGIKSLQAYRLDYLTNDDTNQYIEHFYDEAHIDHYSGMSMVNGAMVSSANESELVSKVFLSFHNVAAVQFAATQSDPIQLLSDQALSALYQWSIYGDASVTQSIDGFHVTRGFFHRTYGQIESDITLDTYGELDGHLYGEIEGGQTNGLAGGGINSLAYLPSSSGNVAAAVRVSSTQTLNAPIQIQIVDENSGTILASNESGLSAGETLNLYTTYRPGSATTPLTWADMEAVGTYGDLDGTTYGSHESRAITGPVFVRVVQIGPTNDVFDLHRISLYDDPISWEFSVDGGTTWYDSGDIRNNVNGVLCLPAVGYQLAYRLKMHAPGVNVSALAIRPWYWGTAGPVLSGIGLLNHGPNRNVLDHYPTIADDPMWQQWDQPIPSSFYNPPPITAPGNPEGGGVDSSTTDYAPFGAGIFGAGIYNRPIDPNNPDADLS